jgi:hypothetical protein
MENQPTQKLELVSKNTNEDLKLYGFLVNIISNDSGMPLSSQQINFILSYNDMDAINELVKLYPPGVLMNTLINKNIEVKKIINVLSIEKTEPLLLTQQPPIVEQEPIKKTKEQFLYGLMLVKDDFVSDENDKILLENIIKKIKL